MNDPTSNDVVEKAIQAAKDAARVAQNPLLNSAPTSMSSRRWPGRQSFATRKMVQFRWRQPLPNSGGTRPSRGCSSTARAWTYAT